MVQTVTIPADNGRLVGSEVTLVINGRPGKVKVGAETQVSDEQFALLKNLGVTTSVTALAAGTILIPATYGSRVTVAINGKVTRLATGTAITPTAEQIALLDRKGIAYMAAVGPSYGPELVVNGAFTQAAGAWACYDFDDQLVQGLTGNVLNLSAISYALGSNIAMVAASYRLEFDYAGIIGGQTVTIGSVETVVPNGTGHFAATIANTLVASPQPFINSGNSPGTLDNLSVRRVL